MPNNLGLRTSRRNSAQRPSQPDSTASVTNDHSARWARTSGGATSATALKYSGISPHSP